MKKLAAQKVLHFVFIFFAICCIQNVHGQVYVNHAATGAVKGAKELKLVANSLEVTNTDDAGSGSLRDVIANAVSNDTIRFSTTIDGDTIKLITQIILDKNLVILGNDTTNTIIDGMANSRIFKINENKKVTIDGIKMQNGKASGSGTDGFGGAVFNEGTASFSNCMFSGNKADEYGGAVYNEKRANFINCIISGNTADDEGGGIFDFDITSFVNCTISGNYAKTGGGIFDFDTFGSSFINGTISGNSASSRGGGFASLFSRIRFSLTNSIIAKNAAPDGPDISGSYTNVSNNFIGGDPLFVTEVPTAPSTGGDLRLQACSPAINAGTADTTGLNLGLVDLAGNPRVFEDRIDIGAYEYQEQNKNLVINTNDDGCGSLRYAVANAVASDTIRFSPTIDGNSIKLITQIILDKDLVILGNDTTNTIIDGMANSRIFKINASKKVTIDGIKMQNGRASGSSSDGDGGAIFNMGTLQIMNSLLFNNNAIRNGGAIFNDFSFSANITIHFANCTISENAATRGGGVYNSSTATFTNCRISGNSADDEGGGVYGAGTLTNCSNCTISGNYAKDGGGFYEDSSLKNNFINCSISGNSASSSGGGIASLSIRSRFSFTNSIIAKNAAPDGPDISGSYTNVSNNFIGGDPLFVTEVPTAPSTGGDLRLQACSPAINAGTADTTGLNLGLVDLAGNPRVFEDRIDIGAYEHQSPKPTPLLVTNNNDDGCGSLRSVVANAVSNDTIRFSPTINGNTINLITQIILDKDLVILGNNTTNTILDGQENSRIFQINSGITVAIDGIKFQNGKVFGASDGNGGAINNQGNLYVKNSNLSGNSADNGGAIFNDEGTASFTNSTINGNFVNAFGGGIMSSGGTISFKNSTIAGNSALSIGGGLYNFGGAVDFTNSIIAKNAAAAGPDISGSYTNVSNNLIGGDPLFVMDVPTAPSTGGDLRLQACSPAINAGTADTTGLNLGLVDLAGNPRVFEDRIDIGAFEYQNQLPNPLIVTNTNDNGIGSLRYLVVNACSGDTIRFSPTINGDTIKLTSGQILIDKNLVIIGNGIENSIIDGSAKSRIFEIAAFDTLKVNYLTIQNGKTTNTPGGGILVLGSLHLNYSKIDKCSSYAGGAISSSNFDSEIIIRYSTISNNKSSWGGGGLFLKNDQTEISNSSFFNNNSTVHGGAIKATRYITELNIANTTISGNSSSEGGGIFICSSNVNITNSTITNNTATMGGGIMLEKDNTDPKLSLKNSILYNSASSSSPDIFTYSQDYIIDEGNNLVFASGAHGITSGNNLNPLLGTLQDNGGPTLTHAILCGSPAYNTGTGTSADQRGEAVFGGTKDIGAYERQTELFKVTARAVSTVICPGSTLNLSALAENGDEAATYAWTGPNGYTDNIQNPVVANADSGMYVVAAVDGLCTAKDSIKITYPEELTITTNPSAFNDIFGCENALTVIGLNIENAAEYTFQWQQSTGGAFADLAESSPYSQVANDTLEINPTSTLMDGYQYRALISNACQTVVSDTFNLRVGATPMITLQPVSQIVCPTNEAILEVDVNGTGVSFQWQIDNGGGFVNVSGSEYFGANSKKLIISNFDYAKSGKAFRCLVFTSCFQIPSDPATITINTDVTILAQPMSQTVCEFGTAIFTAQAVKLSVGTLIYQWQRKAGTGNWIDVNTGGRYVVNGNQLQIANAPASWNGAEFRCLMNDYCQTIPKTLNVIPVAHVTQNPINQEICVGNNAGFSITAAGQGLTYRWQVNSGSGFVNLTDGGIYQGATSANLSLSFPSATVNNYQYRCVVSGTSTCDLVADTSAVASISIGVSAEAQTVFYNSPISTDDGVTQAVGYILGINDILAPNGKAEYRAGNAILLNPGFEVEAGAVFTAKIMNPCQTVSTFFEGGGSKIPKEKVK